MSYYASMRNSQDYNSTYKQNSQMNQSGSNQNIYKSQFNNTQSRNTIDEAFKPKTQRFQWKNINQINIDNIKSTKDISSLNPYFENILCSSLEQNEIQQVPEQYTVQLIHLLQTIGEYLLWSQQILSNENDQLKFDLQKAYSSNNNENDDLIQTLKIQNSQKDNVIKTYQSMMKKEKSFSVISSRDDYNNGHSRPKFYCHFCTNKKFSTEQYLEDHMKRRHMHQFQNLQKRSQGDDYESQLSQIKMHYETMIQSNKMQNEYNSLSDKLNGLGKKLGKSRIDMDMQNRFTMSMNAMRSMGQLGDVPIYDQQPIIMGNNEEIILNQNNNQWDQERELNNTLLRIDENIERNTSAFNKKFNSLLNDVNQFKNSISNEISKVKLERSFERSRQNLMKTSIEDRNNIKLSLQQDIKLSQPQIVEVPEINKSQMQKDTELNNLNTSSIPQQTVEQNRAFPKQNITSSVIDQNASIQINYDNKQSNIKQIEQQSKSPLLKELELFYEQFKKRDYSLSNNVDHYQEPL